MSSLRVAQVGDLLAQTDASMIDWWFKEAYRWLFDASDTSRNLAISWLVFLALILCVSSCLAPMACFASDDALGVSMLLGLLCTVGFLGAIIPWAGAIIPCIGGGTIPCAIVPPCATVPECIPCDEPMEAAPREGPEPRCRHSVGGRE